MSTLLLLRVAKSEEGEVERERKMKDEDPFLSLWARRAEEERGRILWVPFLCFCSASFSPSIFFRLGVFFVFPVFIFEKSIYLLDIVV